MDRENVDRGIDAVLLLDGREAIEPLLAFTQQPDRESALRALGEGIQANPLWVRMKGARLVARAWPEPMVAAFGHFSGEQQALLADLAVQLHEMLEHHRYIDYPAAEQAVERLATVLRARFGEDALSHFRYTAIPRGGWIVLGMLSYLLDLRPDRIGVPGMAERGESQPWVVVDDCALSGVRFQQFLQRCDTPAVIFCPLFAPRELCRAIERVESRVLACLNAEDLRDVAPEWFGEAYPRWLRERRERIGGDAYWCGIAEYVAFAWCEPETKYWDAGTGRFEAGWNAWPPSLCLKRRVQAAQLRAESAGLAEGEALAGIALQAAESGPLRSADRVLWVPIGESIAVAHFPEAAAESAPCFQLDPTAADMWRALLKTGSREGAISVLLEDYAVAPEALRQDLASLVVELEDIGVLVRQ
ncbi:PqqD family protein [Halomonas sp. MCCC 1A11057]|uniref:PqqD family protein n=1 Tax=Halomonas sp. MCCC 1A11057 TaxID=2733482 RepID=UPI001F46A97C|nr:PqqD family protein [Halomonas sp. MCCC 1A11057]